MEVSDRGLKDFLLGAGSVPRRTLEELGSVALERQEPLAELLVAGGYLSRDELRRAHAHLLGVPFVTLMHDDISDEALFLIPEPLARRLNLVAYRTSEGQVEVALLDLASLDHVDFLRTEKNLKVLPRLTTAESIKRALIVYQKKLKEQFGALARGGTHAAEALVRHALLSRASSVHLDFKTAGLLVRYRIKGLLEEAMTLPREAVELMARFKEWARLSPTLHVPQEGAFKLEYEGGEVTRVRVHSLPAHSGERLTLHLSPTHGGKSGFTLESLGLHGESLEQVHQLIQAPRGLVVVAGPAGSGKTTLLYTLLDNLSADHRAVVTIEDEVELTLPHATQLKVRPEVGLHTAATLRAALTQDPDIVLVDEAHTQEVVDLAASAARRGMLVLIGTSDQEFFAEDPDAVVRTVLVRRVCPHCSETYRLARAEGVPFEGQASFGRVLAALKAEGVVAEDAQWKDVEFARASNGCTECDGGYKGLVGLQEVRAGGAPAGQSPLGGALNLAEDGLFKAAQGVTSIEEVYRLVEAE